MGFEISVNIHRHYEDRRCVRVVQEYEVRDTSLTQSLQDHSMLVLKHPVLDRDDFSNQWGDAEKKFPMADSKIAPWRSYPNADVGNHGKVYAEERDIPSGSDHPRCVSRRAIDNANQVGHTEQRPWIHSEPQQEHQREGWSIRTE